MAGLLVTGFKPFLGESENPSELVLGPLAQEFGVRTLTLPVEYRRAFEVLREELRREPADAILLLGQAATATRLKLERVALNLMDASAADEAGELNLETPIVKSGALALATTLPLREWWTQLADPQSYEISNSAGAFVCNSTYYLALNELAGRTPCLFVHLPPLPGQVAAGKAGTSPMELARMVTLLRPLVSRMQGLTLARS
ncbi:MAG: pyroglutamyl-peptidase I [Bdellovibrionaceae bacterium]|nr:pyroglutamyl-peptidase I [Pseudobdellovibrionaceae bacterium]